MTTAVAIRFKSAIICLITILLLAAVWRGWLIQSERVRFNSDEAVVGLMARHITQGKPIPTFYYGQAYMGSLDALLLAAGFAILGESVQTIRFVQAILYLVSIWTGYLLAYTITQRRQVALASALLLAVPTMLGALYTTITLGGYNEIILFGNLILLFGWWVTVGGSRAAWHWGGLGLIMGLGWWTNGAIITPIGVVGLFGLWFFRWENWRLYLLAGAAFLVGSAPWWLYNLNHDWAALHFLLNNEPQPNVEPLTLPEKLIAFLIIGLSGLYGFRFPWQAEFQFGILALAAGLVYLLLVTDTLMRFGVKTLGLTRGLSPLFAVPMKLRLSTKVRSWIHHRNIWVWLCFAVLFAVFMVSSFQDATGRYLTPLWVPAAIGTALGLMRLRRLHSYLPAFGLGMILVFHAGTVLKAGSIEAQLDEDLLTTPEEEQALINFLASRQYQYGYTSYWVSYLTMFQTEEAFIFDTSLPYDENGYRPHNNRYQPYVDAVAQADQVVWITQHLPALDARITESLDGAGITYQVQAIGVYRVYYDFSERAAPADFGLNSTEPFEP